MHYRSEGRPACSPP
ncbi:hypothetical protein ACFQAT_14995 [Undibacterium arcticum]|uniref:Uncharacterized protein n=1 Tax=Undibacterium arcticum TaxID=1762892 RepID=A0ABV7F139_9BURK